MDQISHPSHREIKLNLNKSRFTFRAKTNWVVIAGAPSSGKSTLINQLMERGFKTVPEMARLYLNQELAKGRSIQEIRSEQKALQYCFMDMQIKTEQELNPAEFLFLDRGLPDHFGYCRLAEVDPNEFLADCFHFQYACVYILAPLQYEEDGLRDTEAGIVNYFDYWTTRDYQDLGYEVTRVPVLPREERLNFILTDLSTKSLLKDRS